MSEWKEIELRDVCSDIAYGYTASANDNPIGPKFLRITDIASGPINWKSVPYCKINEKDSAKYKLEVGDIVIARTGATTGYNAIIKNEVNAVFASYLIRYKVNKKIAEPFFIGYVLQSDRFQDYVDAIAGGSAQPGANAQQFADFEFLLPTLHEQIQIASILTSLDDKIDLLHRQNKTLEQLAETLFRQWFVEEAEENWEKGTVGDLFKLQRGFDLPSQNRIDGKYQIITSSGSNGTHHEYKVKGPGVTTGRSGLLGNVFYIDENFWPLNTSLFILEFKIAKPLFAYFFLKTLDIISLNGGSAVPTLNRNDVHQLETQLPPIELVEAFEGTAKSYFQKIKSNTNQISILTQLRDTLLPKLMSGEVRVNN